MIGANIVGKGRIALGFTFIKTVFETESVQNAVDAFSFTVNVFADVYVCAGAELVDTAVLSPKFHVYVIIGFVPVTVEVFVKFTEAETHVVY